MKGGGDKARSDGYSMIAPELAFLVHREMRELGIIPDDSVEETPLREPNSRPSPLIVVSTELPATDVSTQSLSELVPAGSYELRSSRSPKPTVNLEKPFKPRMGPPSNSPQSNWVDEFLSTFDKVRLFPTRRLSFLTLIRIPAGRLVFEPRVKSSCSLSRSSALVSWTRGTKAENLW